MATRKELVNEVLRRLREPELGADSTIASSTYATMVASFLNDVKQECEDAWGWGQLRETVQFDTVSGTSLYSLPLTTEALMQSNTAEVDNTGYNVTEYTKDEMQEFETWNNLSKEERKKKIREMMKEKGL